MLFSYLFQQKVLKVCGTNIKQAVHSFFPVFAFDCNRPPEAYAGSRCIGKTRIYLTVQERGVQLSFSGSVIICLKYGCKVI